MNPILSAILRDLWKNHKTSFYSYPSNTLTHYGGAAERSGQGSVQGARMVDLQEFFSDGIDPPAQVEEGGLVNSPLKS